MKKVGIMSMQRIANYGSFLQAYALKQLIEELGCEVEFVDYHVEQCLEKDIFESNNDFIRKIKKAATALSYDAPLFQKIAYIKYKKNFAKKYIPLLGVKVEKNYNPQLDCLIIGSDEVFNCIQKNKNVGYSLELFGKNHKSKKLISFSASFGNTTLKKLQEYKKENEIAELLKKFDAISVRDDNSGSIVKKLTGNEPEYNLDPVLLYNYSRDCSQIPVINTCEKYMILYAYAGRISKEESEWIKNYAKEKKLKVYCFGGVHRCADRFIDCSPFEVLAYFQRAEEIITDTFHGSVFSIINHKPFSTIVRRSNNQEYGNEEKITDLLKRLKLLDHMTDDIKEVKAINFIETDYNKVDKIIDSYREKTKEYLKEQIVEKF